MAEPPREELSSAAAVDDKDKAGSPSAEARMSHVIGVWSTMLNIMAAFAAPRVLAKIPAEQLVEMTQARILTLVDEYIETFMGVQSREASGDDPRDATVEPLRRVRALLSGWAVSHQAPGPLVQAARDFLRAFGLPAPNGGWDAWEGPSDEPAPCPTLSSPRSMRPEPMTSEEWVAWRGPGELVHGVLVEEETATPLHDAVVARLHDVLSVWASTHGAQVFGPDHKLVLSASGGRKPDVCLYTASDPLEGDSAATTSPPSLVVEVMSPEKMDQRRDNITKGSEYSRFGVRFYWRVDPVDRAVTCTRLLPDGHWLVSWLATEGKLAVPELDDLVLDLDALWGHESTISQ